MKIWLIFPFFWNDFIRFPGADMKGVRDYFCAFLKLFIEFFLEFFQCAWKHIAHQHISIRNIVIQEISSDHFSFPSPEPLSYFCQKKHKGIEFKSDRDSAVVFCSEMYESSVSCADVINLVAFGNSRMFQNLMNRRH